MSDDEQVMEENTQEKVISNEELSSLRRQTVKVPVVKSAAKQLGSNFKPQNGSKSLNNKIRKQNTKLERTKTPALNELNGELHKNDYADYPAKAAEPKVLVPFENPPEGVPRKIVIERKRRLFEAQNIEELLRKEGIDYSKSSEDSAKYESFLPLEIFDDSEFDCRSPREWIELGKDGDTMKYVPAKALLFDQSNRGSWRDCRVIDCKEDENKYLVESDFTQNATWIPRINLLFKAEDPFVFVKRVVTAHKKRKEAEALMRYKLYIENMPIDEIPGMGTESEQKIRSFALNTKKLKDAEGYLSVSENFGEVESHYARTMNKIIFDINMKDPSQKDTFSFLSLPEEQPQQVAPFIAGIQIPPNDFDGNKKKFQFQTYITEDLIIKALQGVKNELLAKQQIHIFSVPTKKTSNLEDFEQGQNQSIDKLLTLLKETWLKNIQVHIKTTLQGIGKGWLNINEKNREIYEMSKLKRFMTAVKFMMEDSLRVLVADSLNDFVQFIKHACNYEVKLENIAVIESNHNSDEETTKPKPLFTVELVYKDKKFDYATDLEKFVTSILLLYDRAILEFQKIPDVEPMVMSQFFWSEAKMLNSVRQNDPAALEWRKSLELTVMKACEPLKQYLRFYDQYKQLLDINVAEYIKTLESEERSVEDLKKEINKHMEQKKDIGQLIPLRVIIGAFVVECTNLRTQLMKKAAELGTAVLNYFAKVAKNKSNIVREGYMKISREINKPPQSIEQLVKLKEYMKSIPSQTEQLDVVIGEMKQLYDLLDSFKYSLQDDDFKQKCSAISWPKKLQEQEEQVVEQLGKEKEKFQERLVADQSAFDKEIDRINRITGSFNKHTDLSRVAEIAHEVKMLQKQIKECQDKAKDYNNKEILFEGNVTEYKLLGSAVKGFQPYADLWLTANDWTTWYNSWMNDPFEGIDAEKIKDDVKKAERTMAKCVNTFKDQPAIQKIAQTVQKKISDFMPLLPLVVSLRNPGMRERHWTDISKAVNMTLIPGETFKTLKDVIDLGLLDHIDKIQKISDVASKEYTIEKALSDMKKAWSSTEFEVKPYRKTGTYVIKIQDETQQQLDDHIALTQTLGFSSFKKVFEADIEQWGGQLNLVSEILEEWINCQREWIALEPIFSSPEMIKQLPQLYKKFKQVDTKWRQIMEGVNSSPNIMNYCTSSNKLLKTFQENNVLLSSIQKGLNSYLETKRKQFARLYFLADDELLTILAQSKEPRAVQPYLKKCFESIHSIKFEDNDDMTAMYSKEEECIQFSEMLRPEGSVEIWLKEVEKMMKVSVKRVLKDAILDYKEEERKRWVLSHPGQVIIVGSQIFWTKEVTSALQTSGTKGLREYHEKIVKQLEELTQVVQTDISKLDRVRIGALLTIEVHARDVVEQMVEESVSSVDSFEWMSQMRYYWEDDDCIVKQVEAIFIYGYEYLGNTSRLVITPLTDRIYLTLTGALHLGLGGAPAGPAGTGKTETVKDLAKSLAKQCVVFNCQEALDEFAMGKFFKGLVMAGAWACFDEFNRIDVEVLSVVAQQILTLQEAVKAKLQTCEFENSIVTVDPTFAIFITMNPGYAGRTELPDNLKALFRPVACMVPDYALIGEIRLFSFGFSKAKSLSKKMVATFKLSSEQLSSQDHYDFGMRAVNTVIAAAGLLKREDPSYDEELLLLRALRDSNLPKFLANDVILFNGIINDLFPNVKPPEVDYGGLQLEIENSSRKFGLQCTDVFKQKVIQMYETSVLRHGLMLVGQTGGGKTSNFKVLQSAMTALSKSSNPKDAEKYRMVKTSIINPKAVKMWQLYGEYDQNTREWKDGVLANEFRKFAEEDRSDARKWLIFDGPVDALWIETMNSVLDENKKLCLASGAIIEMSSTMNIVFEVEDLAVASPATVSRCGMIYMDPALCVPTSSHIASWIQAIPESLKPQESNLNDVISKFLQPLLDFIRNDSNVREYVPSTNANLIQSFFRLLDCLFRPYTERKPGDESFDEKVRLIPKLVHPFVIFALCWSVGASCDNNGRKGFDTVIRRLMKLHSVQHDAIPDSALIYDYFFDAESQQWMPWLATVPEYVQDPKMRFKDIIVPTTDTIRYSWLVEKLLTNRQHVLCVGPTGTGKSLIISEKLMKGLPETYIPMFIFFSARTDVNKTQDLIFNKLEKVRKGVRGPPSGKDFIVFVDDMNMPARETYGAQPPVELLRQWMDHKGWYEYNSERLSFTQIEKTTYIAAMGPPGGGRNPVTNRFLRHFNFIAFPEMDNSNMAKIFCTILNAFLSANYNEEVQKIGNAVVDASILLYNTVREKMLPTPSKSHYTFNLRDVAKVFQGMLDADSKRIQKTHSFLRLWVHENARVFRDRMVDDEDRSKFDSIVSDTLKDMFNLDYSDVVDTNKRLVYGDYANDKKNYEEIGDMGNLVKVMIDQLETYNSTNDKQMNLVLFLDAIEHVSRITRILRQPGGNALLLGVGGSGRQSLTRLAASISDFKLYQVEITKNFDDKEWKEFLKKVMMAAGVEDQNVVFLFCDTQILKESFLEDVNALLNSGDVPNLFEPQDLENIYGALKAVCAAERLPITPVSMYARFIKRVKENLHIVLAMSPSGEVFRNRLRMFPSLVTCCTIDWFSEWPDEALLSVARAQLGKGDIGKLLSAESIYQMCMHIHQSVRDASKKYLAEVNRYNYVTPTSYLELLSTFESVMTENDKKISQLMKKFEVGLQILQETEKKVQELQSVLTEKQPILEEKQRKIAENMIIIQRDKEAANETKEVVSKEEEEANRKKSLAVANKAAVDADLAQVLPMLDKALKALQNLDEKDIKEVGTYKVPPGGVKLVMEAVCVMMDKEPKRVNNAGKISYDWWVPSVELLANPRRLKTDMIGFDKDHIPEKKIKKIEKEYITKEDFKPAKINNVSQAATAMCEWVIAMYNYDDASKKIEPKRKAAEAAQQEVKEVEERLAIALQKLKEVEDKISILESENNKAVAEQTQLEREVKDCQMKLERAEKLIGGLGGEKIRWNDTLADLLSQKENIVGDMLISAGFVAYLGVFTADYRNMLVSNWKNKLNELSIKFSKNVSLTALVEPLQIRAWTNAKLPADSLSIENAIILSKARRWPLMIDPQLQANKWIRNTHKDTNLKVVSFSQKDYLRTLMNAVQFGNPVLLENVGETLDPAIEPILLKQIFIVSGSPYIRIGEDAIPYNPDFKLYMTTKLRNPHYAPESCVKVTLLNFFITPQGLEDQLLGAVVGLERPELEEQKLTLIMNNVKLAKELKDIQDNILQMLSNNEGDILDNEKLIVTLQESKVASANIKHQVEEAEKTEAEIDGTRNKYRPVAYRGSILFFCISDMANIDPMYQYSLQWFSNLFNQSVDKAEKSDDINQRLQNLITYFTYTLYNNVCQSLFEAHKLLFSFVLCIRIMQGDDKVDGAEYRFFLTGGVPKESLPKPSEPWITDLMWNECQALTSIPKFTNFITIFQKHIPLFKTFFESSNVHKLDVPCYGDLTLLQKLLVVRCLRPDKVIEAVIEFVTEIMGKQYVEPPRFDLARSYKDSNSVIPLIFILSAGADPKSELDKFAEQMRIKKLDSISLGRGTEAKTEQAVQDAKTNGTWVLLQNCHLATSFMPTLEKMVEDFTDQNHRDFRLWLTSMPSKTFPVSILQNSVKMTLEPPKGLKANLMGSYDNLNDNSMDHPTKPVVYKKLLFALCFFHAVIQERRKFGPLGWNIPYEYTRGDLKICIMQLAQFLEKYDEVPYKVIKFLTGQINYGGRVTDDWDRRTLMTIINNFITPEVLNDTYKFSPLDEYISAPAGEHKDYVRYLESFSLNTHPELFGLHDNAQITYNITEMGILTETILGMAPRASGGAGKSREAIIEDLANYIIEKIPDTFNLTEINAKYPTKKEESMNTVLVQEVMRYNKLLAVVRSSLKDILKALKGIVVMSKELEAMGNSLFMNQVPKIWEDKAYPSLMPLASWVNDLKARCDFIQNWHEKGIPKVFWISGFFFPQAFLTGTLQNYARKHNVAIDTVSFAFQIIDKNESELASKPEEGCYIRGFFMEGAKWDAKAKCLGESDSKILYTQFPIIWLKPETKRQKPTTGFYECPCYKTLRRAGTLSTTGHSTNFILPIEIPSDKPQEHWVKRGVALITALKY